jgi:hypothetical protein
MVGGGEPARPRADDQHLFPVRWGLISWRQAFLDGEVAEEPLDGMNADRLVQAGAIAAVLARMIADAAHDRR